MPLTLHQVLETITLLQQIRAFVGSTEKFERECQEYLQRLAEAICTEQQVDKSIALSLPDTTELGNNSQKIFGEFVSWLKTQHEAFQTLQTEP